MGEEKGTTSKGITFDGFDGVRVIQLVSFVGAKDFACSTKIFENTATIDCPPKHRVWSATGVDLRR